MTQTVTAAFTAEERDSTRKIAQSTQIAWKKDFRSNITFFTIGVSRIGGNDIIAGPAGVQSAWNRYLYNNESSYVTGLAYERELNLPMGGLVKAQADVYLDNTSGRFTPRWIGGRSEIFTAIQPRRPMIVNAGFNLRGVDTTIPQFVGLTDKQAEVDVRNATAKLHGADFVGYLQNRIIDQTSMFTSSYASTVFSNKMADLGFATAQYEADSGINRIGFGIFETGAKWGDVFNQMAQAENAHILQDEEGVIRWWNRQHYDVAPYTNVQRIITTSQVINAKVPDTDHLVNIVEITASPRDVVTDPELIWQLTNGGAGVTVLAANTTTEVWANYDDPIYAVTTPVSNGTVGQTSYFVANSASDATGTDLTTHISLSKVQNFAQATKFTFSNSGAAAFLTTLDVWGRPARKTGDIYFRDKVGSSITAYEEHILKIDNNYIQDSTWAQSYATMILQDYSTPDKLAELTIRAMPELQLGDLISWQGHYWRVYGIKTQIDPGNGFVQDLSLVQAATHHYFRIGISTIGGSDAIAP
jgi:hypothetical protein